MVDLLFSIHAIVLFVSWVLYREYSKECRSLSKFTDKYRLIC